MREYLLIFLIAAVATYVTGVVAREAASRLGAVAKVRDRDVHATPIPYFGGIAMLAGLGAAFLVMRELPFLSTANAIVFDDAGAVLIGGALICVVGVIDDVFELDALTKFAGQVVAAVVVVAQGVQFLYLPLPGLTGTFVLDPLQAALFSVLVIVATVNAVNFIDGLDGLAAGVIGIGAAAFFIFAYLLARENAQSLAITAALLTAALAGACAGFLPHNFFPARMFMGDSGSMLIGLVLAGSAISLTGQFPATSVSEGIAGARATLTPTLLPLILPVAMAVVPFVDLFLAVVRRTRAGRSPFSPDKMHLHHRLLQIGHSHRRVVLLIYLWVGIVAFGTASTIFFDPRYAGGVMLAAIIVAIVVTVIPLLRRGAELYDDE
jgi:UDP-GlcNAc:undecaprenyl-phosphate/decaprenyl-phosphate GlcNAc-1-phosphate transferase